MTGAPQNRVEVDQSALSRVKLITSTADRICINVEAFNISFERVQDRRMLESKDSDSILVW